MKLLAMLLMPGLTLARVCGEEEAAPPSVASAPAATAPAVEVAAEFQVAKHGGTVVVAEDHAVEVVPTRDEVRAYVVTAEGTPAPPQTSVSVALPDVQGHLHQVELRYEPELHYYVAPVEFDPGPGSLGVAVAINGRARFAQVPSYTVVEVEGPAVAVAPARVEVRGERPRARVDVRVNAPPPPSVRVEVNAPRPPSAHVRIEGPRPPHLRGSVRVRGPSAHVRVRGSHPTARVRVRGGHPGRMLGHRRGRGMRGRGMRGRGTRGMR